MDWADFLAALVGFAVAVPGGAFMWRNQQALKAILEQLIWKHRRRTGRKPSRLGTRSL